MPSNELSSNALKPRPLWLVGVLVPTSKVSATLEKWGDTPNMIIPLRHPAPHPRWGSFVWVFGVNHTRFSSDWLPKLTFDEEIITVSKVVLEEPADINYFPSRAAQAKGEVFWAWISRLEDTSDVVFKNEKELANSVRWSELQDILLTVYQEAEDELFEEVKFARELELNDFLEEGKGKGLFIPDYSLNNLLSDIADASEDWWDISHTAAALDAAFHSFAVALGTKVKAEGVHTI